MVCLYPRLPHRMNALDPNRPLFYFALPRLMATMRGAEARRAESNGSRSHGWQRRYLSHQLSLFRAVRSGRL